MFEIGGNCKASSRLPHVLEVLDVRVKYSFYRRCHSLQPEYTPDGAESDDGGEAGRELVTPEGVAGVHAGDDLHALQPDKLKVRVVETVVCQHLPSKYNLSIII